MASSSVYAGEACPQTDDSNLPSAFQSWTRPNTLTAASSAPDQPQIQIGQSYIVQLKPVRETAYDPAPKTVKPDTFGGLLMLTVKAAGDYTVALDSPVWVDVIRDGQAVESITHGHGPDCTSLRKKVVFLLTPGTFTVQLANARDATVKIEVEAGRP
ncbi:hypothetical protein [Asticcacaulis sp. AC402]|uniref:hypothetical protein n=1 Tax=Asticcacaulis sp. AC402 TaxID=1282361 RepID=UPI0012DD78A6|nr:hypothetical protein [Asticcacaulis sp. AC402]